MAVPTATFSIGLLGPAHNSEENSVSCAFSRVPWPPMLADDRDENGAE
jgi:hypothetical protein